MNYNYSKTKTFYLKTEKTLAIFPIALILFLITSFLKLAAVTVEKHKIILMST